jgi:ferritin-like metal-binding protein YciE
MHKETLLTWLKDAYAMEQGSATAIEKSASDARDYPDLQLRLNEHLEQTRRHADLVEGCIKRLGDDPSAVKTGMAKVSSWFEGITAGMARDDVIKHSLSGYAMESFEIACYRSLVAAARQVGDTETASVCEGILREEEEMARWLEGQIPTLTERFMAEQAAKH